VTNISFEPVIDLNSKAFHRTLAKQGFKFKLSTKVVGTEKLADGRVGVKVEAAKGGDAETVSCYSLCPALSLPYQLPEQV